MTTRMNHKFTYPELNYDAPVNFQPCTKLTIFFHKPDDLSPGQFSDHWAHFHADILLAMPLFRKLGLRYSQYHQSPEMKARFKSTGLEGINLLEHDGYAELWFRTWMTGLLFRKAGS
ncbi:hypothetical protein P170DRAFT_509462 [Aspergillus steynii IBT 23096]|uniref:EthD domain-containing protein n=1 Tax=Aspergillus steynii IBT 23096 TaxID=1392250 RepID=A0A2I2G796_9EURO|nr:uncharacterized protein P170DRAFT_509462 [Aspergillus steynii IBT 23096]PLB48735.1 hypothetical protein P170DRAFT_509462 [Aspergillus steynii IBT 23096]